MYLIDEAYNVGKGVNCISMLHHFLENYSFGETHLHFHADNCSGQNKNRYKNGCTLKCINVMIYNNRYMMAYLLWRVMARLNKEVTISFLLVGHTKFGPTGDLACSIGSLRERR